MTHTNSTNGARNDTSTASIPRLTGWRHSATWTYLIMLIASAVAWEPRSYFRPRRYSWHAILSPHWDVM